MLNLARDGLGGEYKEDTGILMTGCGFAVFLLGWPAALLYGLITWLHINPFYTWLTTWWQVAVFGGLLAAFAISMGGSIAFLVWRLTWFDDKFL